MKPRSDAFLHDDSSDAVWEGLKSVPGKQPDSSNDIVGLIHDLRNLTAAMDIYSELLDAPGVLTPSFRYLAGDLILVSGRSRTLLQKLALLVEDSTPSTVEQQTLPKVGCSSIQIVGDVSESSLAPFPTGRTKNILGWQDRSKRTLGLSQSAASKPIESLAVDLRANREILSALIGPAISTGFSIDGCDRPVSILSEDLTRVLINLATNAAQAMPSGGHLQITLQELPGSMLLTFTDTGPGIPESALEEIFESGYTTRVRVKSDSEDRHNSSSWPVQHRGLGLAIVRSIVIAAGGKVWAANRPVISEAPGDGSTIEPCLEDALIRSASAALLPPDTRGDLGERESTTGAILNIEFPFSNYPR